MVMKPEPWGEAFDALGVDGRHGRRADPVGAAVHPGAGPRAGRPGAAGLRLRSLRGHRPAGARPRRDPGRGPRGLARRLRAQRRRGGRAGDHRGRGPAAARVHGQRRLAGRGVPRGRPARVPRLHQARLLARARRAAGAALRRPRRDRRLAARPGRAAYGASGGRTCCPRPRCCRRRGRSCRSRPADAGELLPLQRACWVQEAATTTWASGSRRCTSRSTTCATGSRATPCWWSAAAGRLVGAVRGRARRRPPGTSAG